MHGQKQRFMWDGIFIDRVNSWFGSRRIPFTDENSPDYKKVLGDLKLLDLWAKLKKGFLSQNPEELRSLSQWFEKLSDPEKCQIIDVFMECEDFKNAIKSSRGEEINKKFKLDFSKLIELSEKIPPNQLPKFTDLFSKTGVFYIGGFQGYEKEVGTVLNSWLEEEIKKEISSEPKNLEKEKKLNGMNLMKAIVTGEKYGDGCEFYLKNNDEKEVFWECFIEKQVVGEEDPYFKGEIFLNPKVLDVVKAGTIDKIDSNKQEVGYVPATSKQNFAKVKKDWKEFPENKKKEVKQSFNTNGQWKGILDVSCSHIAQTGLWSWISFATNFSPEKFGCWEFYSLLFRTEKTSERRFCLFEVPKGKSYLKETNLFGPFMMSSWVKGNKLWMKCHIHSL
ncbi:hypothetical protein MSUIS_04930 [Mycoplasma suis KI3806]|uniref:Uncharacterized protein n=1 Tax=Mycoplasma suis (strain KI_3806) TaxID=708248 RepID=F0V1Q5_MYCS3|nr:hypothetical protein MSUIS_04930 [Mycoplasma suis KI3806]